MAKKENFRVRIPSDTGKVCAEIKAGFNTLYEGTGMGSNMRGWLDWPQKYLRSEEYQRLKKTADEIRDRFDHVIVIGIGGSYLGAKAIIEAAFANYNLYSSTLPYIHFVASLSSKELRGIMDCIGSGQTFCIIYISKSGNTKEPAIAFRTLYEFHRENFGTEPTVYAITDAKEGTLRRLADEYEWESFVIPDDIGGRFSVFTPVGLLPIAVAGINTDEILMAAAKASEDSSIYDENNSCIKFANFRFSMWKKGINVEVLAVNNPELHFFAEWYKQLYAESLGKNYKGVYPTSAVFSTDLHSVGQYIRRGSRILFEVLLTWGSRDIITIPESSLKDNLESLAGRTVNEVNAAAMQGSFIDHSEGENGNPCCKVTIPSGIYSIAYSMQKIMTACGIEGYAMGENPFDQPDVEGYKNKMNKILSKEENS